MFDFLQQCVDPFPLLDGIIKMKFEGRGKFHGESLGHRMFEHPARPFEGLRALPSFRRGPTDEIVDARKTQIPCHCGPGDDHTGKTGVVQSFAAELRDHLKDGLADAFRALEGEVFHRVHALQCSGEGFYDKTFDEITRLEIVKIFEPDPAFEALLYLTGIFLETPYAGDLSLEDHD